MSEDAISPIKFQDSQIVEMSLFVDTQRTRTGREEEHLDMTTDFFLIDMDGDSVQLNLKVEFEVRPEGSSKRKRKPKPLIAVGIGMRCIVSAIFTEDIPREERDFILRVNAISLLFGEARTHVAMLTALSPAGKIMLPTIDPFVIASSAVIQDPQE
jgi:hypothetical protein